VCTICGSSQPDNAPVLVAAVVAPPTPTAPMSPRVVPPGAKVCPGCGQVYDASYTDVFCVCGVELTTAAPGQGVAAPPVKPPPGTPCLVLIGADKQPLRYFALDKDVTVIGRLDPVAGTFPEIDVTQWLEPALARKVSRQHALILRSRQNAGFTIRPLAGNTGTQIEADMVLPLHDYPLKPGTRLVLGGAVRCRFEIT
jgi:hypothetical protein